MSSLLSSLYSRASNALRRLRGGNSTIAYMPIDDAWRDAFTPNDRFLVSYPRSGNTWLRHLVRELILMKRPQLEAPTEILALLPTVHHRVATELRCEEFGLASRFFKSHNVADLIGRPMVYLFRQPADALVSYYHHQRRRAAKKGEELPSLSIDESCRSLLAGWCEHMEFGITQARKHPEITHFASYESLQSESARTLKGIADFLKLESSDQEISEAIERCKFSRLQTRESELVANVPNQPFFRKGRVGAAVEELVPGTLEEIESAGTSLYRTAVEIADRCGSGRSD